jgi:HK97 family phage major capsid protein
VLTGLVRSSSPSAERRITRRLHAKRSTHLMQTTDKGRVRELTSALEEKSAEIENLSGAWKTEGKGIVVSPEQHKDYLKAIAEAEEIKALIEAEEKADNIRRFLDGDPSVAGPAAGAAAADGQRQQFEAKSLGQTWLDSDAYTEMKASGFRQFGQTFSIEQSIHALPEVKDVYSAMGGTITIPTIGSAQALGFTERTLRPGRVRDLFPAERTTASMLYGIRETGYTNRARVVPERTAADGTAATGGATDVYGLKPKSDLTIVPVTYPIATIAHIMYVHKNTLDDEPRMRGLLDRDMVDGVKMAEDEQLLYGDGVGDNLTGLVNTPGIQTYLQGSGGNTGDKKSAAVRRAATRAILAYFEPTGVVFHPLDWEDVELEEDGNGGYRVAVSVAIGAEKRLWRLNVVDSPAMQEGKFLVGAFGTGAKVYDREQVNVQVSTENRDMFERNAVTLRAEERLGLVVDRPESFVYGTFV